MDRDVDKGFWERVWQRPVVAMLGVLVNTEQAQSQGHFPVKGWIWTGAMASVVYSSVACVLH